jgi:quercetin dioxygenase-like cupin family protein
MRRRQGLGFVLGVVTACLAIPSVSAQFRTGRTATLLTTDLKGWCDGKEVAVELNEFGPGTSGKHYHPGHSFTWILEGSETYTVDGKPSRVVKPGEILHEEPQQLHTVDNDAPVKLLVFRVVEKGRKLVDGELFIDSKPGQGTTIRARVPLSPKMNYVGVLG